MRQNQRIRLQIASEGLDFKKVYVPGKNGTLLVKNKKSPSESTSDLKISRDEDVKLAEVSVDSFAQPEETLGIEAALETDVQTTQTLEDLSLPLEEEKPKKKSPFPPKKKKTEVNL